MSFIRDLIAKGVSQAGAVEVLLGQPLTRYADRQVLSRLSVAAAKESLSQPLLAPSVGQAPDWRVNQIVSKVSGVSVASMYMASVIRRTQTDTRPADPALEQKINNLKASIRNVEREIENLVQQLLRLAVPPPGMPLPIWEVQLKLLRNLIKNMRGVLASLMKQLADLTGQSSSSTGGSFGSRTSSALGSGSDAQRQLEDLTKSNNSGSSGGGSGSGFA